MNDKPEVVPVATSNGATAQVAPPPTDELAMMNTKQRLVYETIASGGNVLCTGSAGTGKSWLLNVLRKKRRMSVTASTGIAAINVSGCTLHSWAGLGLGEGSPELIAKNIISRGNEQWMMMKMAKTLAIDEISMISSELFTKFDRVMRIVRGSDRAFGGIQLVLFGDFLQLPPVGKDGEAVRFAFESPSWKYADIRTYVLDEVVRQSDKAFASVLQRVRLGDSSEEVRQMLRPRINAVDPDPKKEPVTLATHNEIADRINIDKLAALSTEECSFTANDWAKHDMFQKQLDRDCLAPKVLRLKVGARVMLLRNLSVLTGLANGTLGTVVEIEKKAYGPPIPHVLFDNGERIAMEHAEWEIKKGDNVLASRMQFPLRLSYAITVHKSQGMTLDKVRVHLKRCFADGQAYVALSRARTLEGLFIADISGNSIKANQTALDFYQQSTR